MVIHIISMSEWVKWKSKTSAITGRNDFVYNLLKILCIIKINLQYIKKLKIRS